MLVVDDNTNVGWTVFLRDKSGPTLCRAFGVCHSAVKIVAATYGSLDIARFEIRHEFTNTEFRKLLTELGIAVEYTPVDGAKRNSSVERKLVLIAEGAKVAWLEFPRHFPDLEFPNKALEWTAIWPEASKWMNDCMDMTAHARMPDKLCLWDNLYKTRATSLSLPFIMSGFRHHQPETRRSLRADGAFTSKSATSTSRPLIRSSSPWEFAAILQKLPGATAVRLS